MEVWRAILSDASSALIVALIMGLFHAIRRVITGVGKINRHLEVLNGSVAKLKDQQLTHEKIDNEWHAEMNTRLTTNAAMLHELRGQVASNMAALFGKKEERK